MSSIQHKIHIDKMWGLFIGQFDDNVLHHHYALQICAVSIGKFKLTDETGKETFYTSCFINSNVGHQLKCLETSLIILINPLSSIGQNLYNSYSHIQIEKLTPNLEHLSGVFFNYLKKELTFSELIETIRTSLTNLTCTSKQYHDFEDLRISKAIGYLEQHVDRIVSLKEIAAYCSLSETRFLHLFKEKTRLSFRGYQRWNKLIKSIPHLKTHSITETAHQFGFTDSSHYTRTFKTTFGLSPKILKSLE